ncbi:LolA family protein [Shumkonia mesophila]|uniref:LolA family protein n=1 Tax=Shumkonia mesophila TaxID=2838854 RepID=UPI00293490FB|nr:outer membrane lipoprotein carrier protein LolA [Shumkonia mesophila]
MPDPRRETATMPSRFRQCRAWLWLALAGALLAALPAVAQQPRPAPLTAEDKAEIGRVEDYLNGLKTLQTRFLQVTSTGEYSEGKLYLHRPGRLRIEYDPPVPVLIVANRGWLTYFDKELEQVSRVTLDSTPAGILVREKISLLSGEFVITGFERESQALRISLVRASDPQEGSLALVLADRPLELKKWMVTDAQGVTTTVSLLDARTGVAIDSKLFEFEDPTFFKPRQE